jgi:hypothetical protein
MLLCLLFSILAIDDLVIQSNPRTPRPRKRPFRSGCWNRTATGRRACAATRYLG